MRLQTTWLHDSGSLIAKLTRRNQRWTTRYGEFTGYHKGWESIIIPEYLKPLADTLGCDSVTIQEYPAGTEIAKHIDSPEAGEAVHVLSLGPATMRFHQNGITFDLELPTNSLLTLEGEYRWHWEHSILPVPAHRFSIVFRSSKQ